MLNRKGVVKGNDIKITNCKLNNTGEVLKYERTIPSSAEDTEVTNVGYVKSLIVDNEEKDKPVTGKIEIDPDDTNKYIIPSEMTIVDGTRCLCKDIGTNYILKECTNSNNQTDKASWKEITADKGTIIYVLSDKENYIKTDSTWIPYLKVEVDEENNNSILSVVDNRITTAKTDNNIATIKDLKTIKEKVSTYAIGCSTSGTANDGSIINDIPFTKITFYNSNGTDLSTVTTTNTYIGIKYVQTDSKVSIESYNLKNNSNVIQPIDIFIPEQSDSSNLNGTKAILFRIETPYKPADTEYSTFPIKPSSCSGSCQWVLYDKSEQTSDQKLSTTTLIVNMFVDSRGGLCGSLTTSSVLGSISEPATITGKTWTNKVGTIKLDQEILTDLYSQFKLDYTYTSDTINQ